MAIVSGTLSVHEVVNSKELHDIWPRIREGIEAIRGKCPQMVDMPEDIYHDIKTGKTRLLIGTIDECYEGFFVVGDATAPDGKSLVITLIHNAGDDVDFLENFFNCIKQITQLAGYCRATFAITRPGWLKLLNKMGWGASSTMTYHTIESN